jgi:hypothetical protein
MKNIFMMILIAFLTSSCAIFRIEKYYKITSDARKSKSIDGEKEIYFDGDKEPPWPGFISNIISVEGVDANENGIRDDIEIWINRTTKSNNLRKSLKQFAIADQSRLVALKNHDLNKFLISMKQLDIADSCNIFLGRTGENIYDSRGESYVLVISWLTLQTSSLRLDALDNERSILFSGRDIPLDRCKRWEDCNFYVENVDELEKKCFAIFPK